VEDRKQERILVQWECKDKRYQIEINGEFFPFSQIEDVSVSGAGVTLPLPLDVGTPVQIRRLTEDGEISLRGTIAWCDTQPAEHNPLKPCSFRSGILFHPSDEKASYALYSALKYQEATQEVM